MLSLARDSGWSRERHFDPMPFEPWRNLLGVQDLTSESKGYITAVNRKLTYLEE